MYSARLNGTHCEIYAANISDSTAHSSTQIPLRLLGVFSYATVYNFHEMLIFNTSTNISFW
jgi:hypothetical protein